MVGKQKKTVLFTSHNMDEVEQLCDRMAILHHGRLKAVGDLDGIKARTGMTGSLEDIFIKLTCD